LRSAIPHRRHLRGGDANSSHTLREQGARRPARPHRPGRGDEQLRPPAAVHERHRQGRAAR
jgi:hypothetical protein